MKRCTVTQMYDGTTAIEGDAGTGKTTLAVALGMHKGCDVVTAAERGVIVVNCLGFKGKMVNAVLDGTMEKCCEHLDTAKVVVFEDIQCLDPHQRIALIMWAKDRGLETITTRLVRSEVTV